MKRRCRKDAGDLGDGHTKADKRHPVVTLGARQGSRQSILNRPGEDQDRTNEKDGFVAASKCHRCHRRCPYHDNGQQKLSQEKPSANMRGGFGVPAAQMFRNVLGGGARQAQIRHDPKQGDQPKREPKHPHIRGAQSPRHDHRGANGREHNGCLAHAVVKRVSGHLLSKISGHLRYPTPMMLNE